MKVAHLSVKNSTLKVYFFKNLRQRPLKCSKISWFYNSNLVQAMVKSIFLQTSVLFTVASISTKDYVNSSFIHGHFTKCAILPGRFLSIFSPHVGRKSRNSNRTRFWSALTAKHHKLYIPMRFILKFSFGVTFWFHYDWGFLTTFCSILK